MSTYEWDSDSLAVQAKLLVERHEQVVRALIDKDYQNPIHALCAGTKDRVKQLADAALAHE